MKKFFCIVVFLCFGCQPEAIASDFISIPIHESSDLEAIPADFKE